MGVFASLAYLAVAVSSVTSGWLSDRWISRGGTPTQSAQDFHRPRTGSLHRHSAGGAGARREPRHGAAHAGLHLLRDVRFQRLGHHANSGRTARRRKMDRRAKRHRQLLGRGGAGGYRLAGWPHGPLLSLVRRRRGSGAHWRRHLRFRNRSAPPGTVGGSVRQPMLQRTRSLTLALAGACLADGKMAFTVSMPSRPAALIM